MKYGAIYPSLKGRTVLVTGGGSGIGESIVEHFAAQGSKVGFIDVNEKASKALVGRIKRRRQKVHFEAADLTDIDALRAAIKAIRKALGPITVLVNNAAHDERHTLAEVTSDYFDERINVNLKHQFFAIQAVVDDMKKAKNGAIVNMGSGSWMVAFGGMPVYTAAKAGIVGLTRGLAHELGEHNIRINSIAPGWIMTDRQKELWVTPEAIEQLMRDQCLQRTLEPADIARAVLFYASDEASAVTNQSVVFDGGWV
ncbi:SDR family NAD(P)-dependent oxidoreductase [Bauldia sp.]|uniref:SDR family NAD(P)-dependent oxidoreductase n=1 Tax=Bauldia sp. TaxID=2575872 RepID=UPI003BAC4D39